MKYHITSLNPLKTSKKLKEKINTEISLEDGIEIPPKTPSEKQIKTGQDYVAAQKLHDRFCKFEIPFNPASSIQLTKQIFQIVPFEVLINVDLPFKLNSLAWFLTPKGRAFLKSQEKRIKLNLKKEALDLSKINLG